MGKLDRDILGGIFYIEGRPKKRKRIRRYYYQYPDGPREELHKDSEGFWWMREPNDDQGTYSGVDSLRDAKDHLRSWGAKVWTALEEF